MGVDVKMFHSERLQNVDLRLVRLLTEYDKEHPIIIICGARTQQEQNDAFKRGNSKVAWPHSKHNHLPKSLACDVAPSKDGAIDWRNIPAFVEMGEGIEALAKNMGILISWGGRWKMRDYPHIQLEVELPKP